MSFGRIFLLIIAALVVAGLVYSGVWHMFTLFFWQHPMLSWLPILAFFGVGFAVGGARAATGGRSGSSPSAGRPAADDAGRLAAVIGTVATGLKAPGKAVSPKTDLFSGGWAFLAGTAVLVIGLWFTLISKPAAGFNEIEFTVVDELPKQTQPRLLPRAAISDDPGFRDAEEIHLVRDPVSGELLWTGEWRGSWLGGRSDGVVIRSLDELVAPGVIARGGFEESIGGIRPSTLKGKAYGKHPFSKIQYPTVVPAGNDEVVAVAPYMGYMGFPFRYPYLKGVLVYHQDGELEDLTPEEAMARPELAASGRLVPETVARAQADAISRSESFRGDINDGENNSQPYLTAIDKDTTAWVTVIDEENAIDGVRAIVIADSTTGRTTIWEPSGNRELISSEDVLNTARALPLRWKEKRCCDSEGNSYTVTLREVVEARLAFRNGTPFYMVSVVPTDDLALAREIEFTLVLDAVTGETLERFEHVNGGAAEDTRLQAFFR